MKDQKFGTCDFVGFLHSPFDDKKYGCHCDVCIDGMEGEISERGEYDSLSDDYDF